MSEHYPSSHSLFKITCDPQSIAQIPDFKVSKVTNDSRECVKNSVFVAIQGAKTDGVIHIKEAVKRGARVVVVSHQVSLGSSGIKTPYVRVENTRQTFALLCSNYWKCPSNALDMVAVTGTNGKTTTTYLLKHVLSSKSSVGMMGTVCNTYNGVVKSSSHTTESPELIHSFLNEMVSDGVDCCVMEASSHGLDQDRLFGIKFKGAIFTNITSDHMDYHHSFDHYLTSKFKLLDLLESRAIVVINKDDKHLAAAPYKAHWKSVTYGIDGQADYQIKDFRQTIKGSVFKLSYEDKEYQFDIPLIGLHNIYNATAAIAMAHELGVPLEDIQASMRFFSGIPGRLELVQEGQDFVVFIDYAHTADGLEKILSAIRPLVKNRLYLLFGCGGDRDKSKREEMGKIAGKYADHVVITSDNPRNENPQQISKQIVSGFVGGGDCVSIQLDRKRAVRQILLMASRDDVVVIAGKGHENYQIIGDKSFYFNDADECRQVLKGN